MKQAWVLVLLVGCSSSEPDPSAPDPTVEALVEAVRGSVARPSTLRVRFRGEWPHAVGQMPRTVSGTLLLGEANRAKISMAVSTAFGKTKEFEAISDGTRLWRSPTVEALRFNPPPNALRFELLYALSWHGLGWSFPHGTHPSTIGEGYAVIDMVPPKVDESPARLEPSGTISQSAPNVDYRIRLTFDPASHQPRKRELIGDRGKIWYAESYEVERNPAIPDGEFKLPP